MGGGASESVVGDLTTLFELGTAGDRQDGELLERFLSGRDRASEAAFAVLVERHGPMVLRVCRRMLGDPHQAQDAFQATFLVLVERAPSIRKRTSLSSWLFGVACRVSARARVDAARRRRHERGGARTSDRREPAPPCPELFEEIDRLPEKYRLPIVLHHLEGLTYEQAAKRLECPSRTVQIRLSRGRARLRQALIRRGAAPSAGAIAASLAGEAFAIEVPSTLAWKLARAANRLAAGQAAATVASAEVAALTLGVLRAMTMNHTIKSVTLTLALGALTAGGVAAALQSKGKDNGKSKDEGLVLPTLQDNGKGKHERLVLPTARPFPEITTRELAAGPPPLSNAAIRTKLEDPIDADFHDAPLEDFLNYLKEASSGPEDKGLPFDIYVQGLAEAGRSLRSPISISAKKTPIRSMLDRVLHANGLGFAVRKGRVVIDSRATILELRLDAMDVKLDFIISRLTGKRPEE